MSIGKRRYMKKQSNAPQIRFQNFEDEWVKQSLGKTVEIIMGQSPDSKNYTDNPNDYILVQGNADMQNGRVIPRVWTTQVTKLAEKGDLILSVRAPVGDIGKTDYNVVLGRGVAAIKGNEFLFQLLTKMKQSHYWSKFSTGSTFESINSNDIKSAEIYLPSIEEQSAIGSLFRTLDDLLVSYKDNLANYQSLKTTMLSKMFPKAGQTVPEIRLDGFTGEWKFSSIGEQADITKLAGFEFTKHVVYSDEGEIPAIRGLNVKNQKINLSDVKYIDRSDFSKLNRSKLIENDLLFTYVGTVGEVARVPENVLWYLAPNVSRIRLNRTLDSRFVLYQMTSNRFKQKQISPLIATSSQPALSMANIRKFIISFTTLPEQQAIGSYFSNLDNLINSHQEKISQLETLKKKLLQDMFI